MNFTFARNSTFSALDPIQYGKATNLQWRISSNRAASKKAVLNQLAVINATYKSPRNYNFKRFSNTKYLACDFMKGYYSIYHGCPFSPGFYYLHIPIQGKLIHIILPFGFYKARIHIFEGNPTVIDIIESANCL